MAALVGQDSKKVAFVTGITGQASYTARRHDNEYDLQLKCIVTLTHLLL